MATPFVRIEKQELGFSNDGEKLTILGQIYGYENCNGIAVIEVEGQTGLVFMELNAMQSDLNQIYQEEDIENLNELWKTTEIVDGIAEKMGLNQRPN